MNRLPYRLEGVGFALIYTCSLSLENLLDSPEFSDDSSADVWLATDSATARILLFIDHYFIDLTFFTIQTITSVP